MEFGDRDQLILPYTLEANDMRFATAPGWVTGRDFEDYLTDAFDVLYAEGVAGAPKMLSIGLHCRLVGRPGKIAGLMRFLDHAQAHDGVWFATRGQIAAHWAAHHPHTRRTRPSAMDRDTFVANFGGIYEHSPWVAEAAHALELGPAHDSAVGLANAMARAFRSGSDDARMQVLARAPRPCGQTGQRQAADRRVHGRAIERGPRCADG